MENKYLICKELTMLLKLTRNQSDLKALKYEILDNGVVIAPVFDFKGFNVLPLTTLP